MMLDNFSTCKMCEPLDLCKGCSSLHRCCSAKNENDFGGIGGSRNIIVGNVKDDSFNMET